MTWLRGLLLLITLMVAVAGCSAQQAGQKRSPEGGGSNTSGTAPPSQASSPRSTASSTTEVETAAYAQTTAEESTGKEKTTREETNPAYSKVELPVAKPVGDMAAPEKSPARILAPGAEPTPGLLNEYRMVSYYGHPFTGQMGVLGQYKPEQMVKRLKKQAAAYTAVTPERPAIPTLELISSVAQRKPGDDGDYLIRTPPEVIEEYVKVARENNCLLLLDIQIGHGTIADEVQYLFPYLKLPFVHLAIDPEYDMAPGQVPGMQFGSSRAEEIMGAADTLSQMVEKYDLPPKVLVVHQFRDDMIVNKEKLHPLENVQIALHADGFGAPETKYSKYDLLVQNEPVQYGGFKLFYSQDVPLLSPEQVLSNLDPPPAVVSYQ